MVAHLFPPSSFNIDIVIVVSNPVADLCLLDIVRLTVTHSRLQSFMSGQAEDLLSLGIQHTTRIENITQGLAQLPLEQ